MKIKDLPPDTDLGTVKFIYPANGEQYWWRGQWHGGVWGKKHQDDRKIHPLFIESLSECKEWEVVNVEYFR